MLRVDRLLILVFVALMGCGGDEPKCVDTDLDGFGVRCARGVDCDDADPTRAEDCSLPPVDCTVTPFARGCPCLFRSQRECFDGDLEQATLGICAPGFQQCGPGDQWTECLGSVSPVFESCNGIDDDCDGLIDDGVRSPCGGCDSKCIGGVWGEDEAPFVASDVLAISSRGELTLATAERNAETLWVANTGEDTVSRIDVARAREVARYDSGGSEPTRVAVDYAGDAWIANRAFDGQATVTKIASSSSRCVDRDGAGVDTSTSSTDVKPRGADDCVVLTVPVGGVNGVARALAVDGFVGLDDAPSHVWVGLQNESRVLELDGDTGAVLRSVETPDFEPFDAAFDPWGVLWMIDRDGLLGRLDIVDDAIAFRTVQTPSTCWQLDGMAIAPDGTITLSGFYCDRALLFDSTTERFEIEHNVVSARGVAANADYSFVVHTHGELSVLNRAPFYTKATYGLSDADHDPIETVGIALDGFGDVWAISTLGGLSETGLATRFDLSLETITAQVPVGRLPYSAGDLTGQSLHSVVAPEGIARHVFAGCTSGFATRWSRLHVQWLPGAGSRLGVRVRHATSMTMLSDAAYQDLGFVSELGEPIPLQLPEGGVVEVELTLIAGSRLGAPRVSRVGLEWDCGGLE